MPNHGWRTEQVAPGLRENPLSQPFEEQHFPASYWAGRWGFSVKTVREWFRGRIWAGHTEAAKYRSPVQKGLHHDDDFTDCRGEGLFEADGKRVGELMFRASR